MRRCTHCKRSIGDNEDCYRDFDKKIYCKDCYHGTITTLPQHGK